MHSMEVKCDTQMATKQMWRFKSVCEALFVTHVKRSACMCVYANSACVHAFLPSYLSTLPTYHSVTRKGRSYKLMLRNRTSLNACFRESNCVAICIDHVV